MIGPNLSHYRILSTLGSGAMGDVYLAEDTELGRQVALKVLPDDVASDPERIRRFNQEAKTVSALNHPNILTIHEGIIESEGVYFMVTEYVKGENLRQRENRGPLDLGETVGITTQLAAALTAAHQAGIIHRDIKPENVMIREDGLVKVLDFGLAKLVLRDRAEVDLNALTLLNTGSHTVAGTVPYMSPEQVRGQDIDGRSDVWSLGVCLYEMLSGQRPFPGETKEDTIAAILKESFLPLDDSTPAELCRIVRKALQKDRDERYQVVKEFLNDLKTLTHDLDFAEDRKRLDSPPANTVGAPKESRKYGRSVALGLVALLLASTAVGLWYLRHMAKKAEARKNYAEGRVFFGKRNKVSLLKAKEQFEQAVYNDPNYALAYVGLADYYVAAEEYFGTPSFETIPKAEELIDKALAIDKSLGEAYATRGFIRAKQWKWEEAGAFYRQAIEFNRNYATGRQWYSWYLRNIGDYEESRNQIEFAYKLAYNDNDLLPIIHANVVIAYILKPDYARAVYEGQALVTRYPDFWQGYSWLGKAYQEQGNKDKALENLENAVEISKRSHTILANLGYAYASYGRTEDANKLIDELVVLYNNKDPKNKATGQSIAKIYYGLGNTDKAFEWLEKDLKAGSGDLPNISWHPAFKRLHGDPRFNRILEGMHLPPSRAVSN